MAQSKKGLLGCGKLYFNRVVSGVSQGLIELGNATKLEIKENSEEKIRTSRQCDSYGSPLDLVVIRQPAEVNFDLDELNAENLALVFQGIASKVVQGAISVSAEVVSLTGATLIKTAYRNITEASVVVKSDDGLTTYTVATDYKVVNALAGLIEIVPGGAIDTDIQAAAPAALPIKIDYDAKGNTASKVTGGTSPRIEGHLVMIGKNLVDDSPITVDIWKMVGAPTSPVDFLSTDFTTLSVAGKALLDEGKGNAYEVLTDVTDTP